MLNFQKGLQLLDYRVENTGSIFSRYPTIPSNQQTSTSKHYRWKFALDGIHYQVELESTYQTGWKRITLNGAVMFDGGSNVFQYPFNLGDHGCNIVQLQDVFELRIDNNVFAHLWGKEKRKREFGEKEEIDPTKSNQVLKKQSLTKNNPFDDFDNFNNESRPKVEGLDRFVEEQVNPITPGLPESSVDMERKKQRIERSIPVFNADISNLNPSNMTSMTSTRPSQVVNIGDIDAGLYVNKCDDPNGIMVRMGRKLNNVFGMPAEYESEDDGFNLEEERKVDFEVHPKIDRIKQSKKYDDDINQINPFEQYNENRSFGLQKYGKSKVGPLREKPKRKNLDSQMQQIQDQNAPFEFDDTQFQQQEVKQEDQQQQDFNNFGEDFRLQLPGERYIQQKKEEVVVQHQFGQKEVPQDFMNFNQDQPPKQVQPQQQTYQQQQEDEQDTQAHLLDFDENQNTQTEFLDDIFDSPSKQPPQQQQQQQFIEEEQQQQSVQQVQQRQVLPKKKNKQMTALEKKAQMMLQKMKGQKFLQAPQGNQGENQNSFDQFGQQGQQDTSNIQTPFDF